MQEKFTADVGQPLPDADRLVFWTAFLSTFAYLIYASL